MLKRNQLIGANFSFQHHSLRWTVEKLSAMGFAQMELWGVAPHLDLFHDNHAQLAEVKAILRDNGMTVRCFTPEQVLYPINIASGDRGYREASVERFLRANPSFVLEAAAGLLPDEVVTEDGFMLVLPHVHGCDGAFAARLRKA